MDLTNYFYLGRIIKAKGFKGELKILLDVDEPQNYSSLDAVFVKRKKSLIPYIIQYIMLEGNKATVKLEDVDDEHTADTLAGSELFLPLELLPKLEGDQFYYHEITGFEVIDTEHGPVGRIKGVLDLPANPLFEIEHKGEDILVPINDEIIKEVNRDKKQLLLTIPAGLIELFFEE